MILLHLRDKQSQTIDIKTVAEKTPSSEELLRRSREKVERGEYFTWEGVTKAIEKLWEQGKKHSKQEDRTAVTVLDITAVIARVGSHVVEGAVSEGGYWSFTIQGADKLGNMLTVGIRLPKTEPDLLQIASFQPLRN